jgi:hypothetical protein
MLYEIEGKCPVDVSRIDDILVYAMKHLLFSDEFFLTLKFSDDIQEGVTGYCDEVDVEEHWILVEINSRLAFDELVATLFHELVHCKQILDGHLVQGSPSTWKGVEYDGEYIKLPWEIEAREFELYLSQGYFTSH